ncbi:MAG: L-2-hydroxyglutarate oxidase LhgO [Candidatus Anoxychlamydiales bacterium]|nr:L-2-hydroxyglutarate oxidase LhgO [Candidatus Anoxychlamydiales bacterium]
MKKVKFLIIGAGIIGLASAYQILKKQKNINLIILEKESEISQHQTGRNSGVIHSGLYYKPGSLKAKNCLTGRKDLLNFCEKFNIPTKKCGKVIVATEESELDRLYELEKRGKVNKVEGLEIISKEKLNEIEPNVKAIKALRVPSCAVVDYLKVAKKLKEQIEKLGGQIFLNQKVIDIKKENDEFLIKTQNETFKTKKLINCAGLHSDRIAKMAMPTKKLPLKIIPFRGEYYDIVDEKKDLIKSLVYPVPDPKFPFLGVHLTRMINDTVHAGPNAVFAFAREGYTKTNVNMKDLIDSLLYKGFIKVGFKYWKMGLFEMYRSFSKKAFLKSMQKMLPEIGINDITPGKAGIRAQAIDRHGKLVDDFAIERGENQIHVLNAPSPAATACLSIGKHIANLAIEK